MQNKWICLKCDPEQKLVQIIGATSGNYMQALAYAKARTHLPVFAIRKGQPEEQVAFQLLNWFDKIGIIAEEKMLVLAAVARALCGALPKVTNAEVSDAIAPVSSVTVEVDRANSGMDIVSSPKIVCFAPNGPETGHDRSGEV